MALPLASQATERWHAFVAGLSPRGRLVGQLAALTLVALSAVCLLDVRTGPEAVTVGAPLPWLSLDATTHAIRLHPASLALPALLAGVLSWLALRSLVDEERSRVALVALWFGLLTMVAIEGTELVSAL